MTRPYNPGPGYQPGSNFGLRPDPFTGRPQFHGGMDYRAAPGTPIRAAAAGTVWYSGYNQYYGNTVIIRHESNGRVFYTLYAHMRAPGVRRGSEVVAGTAIGEVGATGERRTGPHLHFEIIRDDPTRRPSNADGGGIGFWTRDTTDLREDPGTFSDWPASSVYSPPIDVPLPRPRPRDADAPPNFDERWGPFDVPEPVPLPRPRPAYPTPADPIPVPRPDPRPRPQRQGFIGNDAQPARLPGNVAMPFGLDEDHVRSGEELDRIAMANNGHFDTRIMGEMAGIHDDYTQKGRRSSQMLDDLHDELRRTAADNIATELPSIPGQHYPVLRVKFEEAARAAGSDQHLAKAFRDTGDALDRMFGRSINAEHDQAWQQALLVHRRNRLRMAEALAGAQEPEDEPDPWSLSPWDRRS